MTVPVTEELCEWCYEDGRNRQASVMQAGIPLCASCAMDTSHSRFIDVPESPKHPEEPKVEFKQGEGHPCRCGCGTQLFGSHGYAKGHKKAQRQPLPAKKAKTIPLMREPSLKAEDVEATYPNADVFIADSKLDIPLSCGSMTLLYRGDLFALLNSKEDLHFMLALLNVIRCRGKMMHPFSDELKTKTGKVLDVQVDEGFVEDMLSMAEPEDKARLLSIMWTRGL